MTITLDLDVKNEKLLKNIDKAKLSFLVSRVFEEYIEELEDEKLSIEIKKSEELNTLLSKVKM